VGVAEAIGKTLVGALVPEDAGNILQVAVNRLLGDEKKAGNKHLRRTEYINSLATRVTNREKPESDS
jgi:hypothetical protein